MTLGFDTRNFHSGVPRSLLSYEALHLGEGNWMHYHVTHPQEDLASNSYDQTGRLMR